MDIGDYRADVRRRAATYAVRATRQLGGEARGRALAAAWQQASQLFGPAMRLADSSC
jgi:hypothetical protein